MSPLEYENSQIKVSCAAWPVHTFFTAAGFCDEKMYLYVAEGIVKNSTVDADEDEFVELVTMSREQVQAALANNQIHDGKTLVALYNWLANAH